jgi:glutaredoxin
MNLDIRLKDFIFPEENQWIIYTKSNCKYCTMAKELLNDNLISPIVVNCDEWIENDITKKIFLDKIKNIIGQEYKSFPMVFKNKTFIGGFTDTYKFFALEKISNNSDNLIISNDF